MIANRGIDSLKERIVKRLELFVSAHPARDSSRHSISSPPPVRSPFVSGAAGSVLNAANPPAREDMTTTTNENADTAELGSLNRRAIKDKTAQRARAVTRAAIQPIKTENNAFFAFLLSLLCRDALEVLLFLFI